MYSPRKVSSLLLYYLRLCVTFRTCSCTPPTNIKSLLSPFAFTVPQAHHFLCHVGLFSVFLIFSTPVHTFIYITDICLRVRTRLISLAKMLSRCP